MHVIQPGDQVRVEPTRWFVAEFDELPPEDQAWVARRIEVLKSKGWGRSMGSKDVVPLIDGIYELRVVGKGPAYRLLFFVLPGSPGRLVVLTGCVRKSRMLKHKMKVAEVERAVARRDAWLTERVGGR